MANITFLRQKRKRTCKKAKINPQTGWLLFADLAVSRFWASALILFGSDELIALAVYVDDFYLVVVFQVLAQLGDVNVH